MFDYRRQIQNPDVRARHQLCDGAWDGASWVPSNGFLNPKLMLWAVRDRERRSKAVWKFYRYVEYNEKYPEIAKDGIKALRKEIDDKDLICDIQHIGSTSIKGMNGKPVVDLMVGVMSENGIKQLTDILIAHGWKVPQYCFGDEYPRIFLQREVEDGILLSVVILQYGTNYWCSRTWFRDYINEHPYLIKEYEDLKKNCIDSGASYQEYVINKGNFCTKVYELIGFKEATILTFQPKLTSKPMEVRYV